MRCSRPVSALKAETIFVSALKAETIFRQWVVFRAPAGYDLPQVTLRQR
jgi:hypothetical protein